MVYLCDVCFRMKLGSSRSFDSHVVDNDLYFTIVDNTVVRKNAMLCFRCKSYEHVVTSCPFPSEYEANKSSKKIQKGFEKWFHHGNEGCNNYQFGKCTFSNCSRAHVCKQCRWPDP